VYLPVQYFTWVFIQSHPHTFQLASSSFPTPSMVPSKKRPRPAKPASIPSTRQLRQRVGQRDDKEDKAEKEVKEEKEEQEEREEKEEKEEQEEDERSDEEDEMTYKRAVEEDEVRRALTASLQTGPSRSTSSRASSSSALPPRLSARASPSSRLNNESTSDSSHHLANAMQDLTHMVGGFRADLATSGVKQPIASDSKEPEIRVLRKAVKHIEHWHPTSTVKLHEFLSLFEGTIAAEYGTQAQMLHLIGLSLTGPARTWHTSLAPGCSTLSTWAMYKRDIQRHWAPRIGYSAAVTNLSDCRKQSNELHATHYLRFSQRLQDLKREAEADGVITHAGQIEDMYLKTLEPEVAFYLKGAIESRTRSARDQQEMLVRLRQSLSLAIIDPSAKDESTALPPRYEIAELSALATQFAIHEQALKRHNTLPPTGSPSNIFPSINPTSAPPAQSSVNYRGRRPWQQQQQQHPASIQTAAQVTTTVPPIHPVGGTGQRQPTAVPPVAPISRDARELSDVECYNCHEKGHYSSTCPHPRPASADQSNSGRPPWWRGGWRGGRGRGRGRGPG
jgi:Retrotransposon gag protein